MTSVAETSPAGERGGQFGRGHAGEFHGVYILPQDPRDLEPLLLDGGRLVEGFGRGQARGRLVVAEHVGQAGRVRRRRDALGGDLLDLRDGRDDLIQLGRQMVEFGVAERDPG